MYERREKTKPEHDSLSKYGSDLCEYAREARETDKTYVTGSYAPPHHFPITQNHETPHTKPKSLQKLQRSHCAPQTSMKSTFFFFRKYTFVNL